MSSDETADKQTQLIKNRIAKIEEKEKQLKARKRAELNRLNQQKRKQRTKRLIQKGAELEKLQGENAAQITAEETRDWLNHKIATNKQLMLEYQNLKYFTTHVAYDDDSSVFEHYQINKINKN
ncbi:hypothetical protein FD13_GL001438 [Levilactobacillus senmaizukei DSM 21775 = NBRC 103853]|uniref:Uncharacterized protein n=1 Tax=Levilactobacillus senmaizukei DSM 21775 = NBRC 103853 TaxID=1423803 RepID=A0A0R2DBB3_9LACO|nr:hypothetical protein [Levilactobacillus senmaizukei]KRN01074.1 hypothetical protein FD13_GL001438 [Levilactobacillus senmaizukei DSM 21775 = NBRC 103853]